MHVWVTLDVDENPSEFTEAQKRALAGEFEEWLGLGRAARLCERDAAVRVATCLYGGISPTGAAKMLANDLRRYLAAGYHREAGLVELPAATSELRRACHRIARLNRGRPLSWKQIWNVSQGRRG